MKRIDLPFGRGSLPLEIEESRLTGVLLSKIHEYTPPMGENELVLDAMANPVGSKTLRELATGKKNVVLIASDHTRPVPSKVIVPHMLREIREGNPDADITILIATGCHRGTTKDELIGKFGEEIVKNEKIVIHDCDTPDVTYLGKLPSGGDLIINRLAAEADLLCSEGFIEPHFFAGFSGGRKSVLPGIASRTTVLANHCSKFIASDKARTGIIEGNPIHGDMIFAAETAKLAYIVNVVINAEKQVIHAVAGDVRAAHRAGCDFLDKYCCVKAAPADIAISTNGGYPLDQNIYQAVKGMTAAEATVKRDGVIIMCADSSDGHGGESFYNCFKEEKDLARMTQQFLDTPQDKTLPDQWEAQVFARVLTHARVVYVSNAPDEMIREMHMTPAHSMDEALKIAEEILGNPNATVAVVPDGVSVAVKA
ncbi:MAG: nickel-dependent lactate racemase [Clostridia bacterium]|nr:nickel-dependent lactate racemase [Clostridia bacterium]